MTPRERFITALQCRQSDYVPHFELVFYLTMEALGKVHPQHRALNQWQQMSKRELDLQFADMGRTFVDSARKYEHHAVHVMPPGMPGMET